MSTLTGKLWKDTYDSLLHVESDDTLNTSLQYVQDGYGNNTTIRVSTLATEINNPSLIGSITLGSPLSLTYGGLGASLSAPVADKLMFYDVSANSMAFLSVGSGLSITGTTLDATVLGGGLTWHEETGTSYSASANEGIVANNSSLVTITLPTTFAVGDTIQIIGKGTGLWRIAQNSGQQIHMGDLSTTAGASGYIDALHRRDSLTLIGTVANTEFTAVHAAGCLDIY